jgi:aspartate/methionine/tyrosine aminotransferase
MPIKKAKRMKKLQECTFACGMPESPRMKRMGTETAFDMLVKARGLEAQGKNIIHLEIGEPDFDTPQNIKDACKKALDQGYTHYGPAQGLPELRKVIAEKAGEFRKMTFKPEQVVVTPGGKPIMSYAIMALVNDGDEVIYVNPGYPIYESMIDFMGGKAVPLPLLEENDFMPDLKYLKKILNKKTRMLIINTPHNPCGVVFSESYLKEMAKMLEPYPNLWVLSDEIYSRVTYGAKFETIAKFPGMPERSIILDGYSKIFAMTGWRAGYGIMHPELAQAISRVATNMNSCTTTFVQRACIEALVGPQDAPENMVKEFHKRRDVIVDGLNSIKGFSCKLPQGAFYIIVNIKKTGYDCRELADKILHEAGVACLSGTCFGSYGKGYLRFSYANSIPNIKEAINRIKRYIEK